MGYMFKLENYFAVYSLMVVVHHVDKTILYLMEILSQKLYCFKKKNPLNHIGLKEKNNLKNQF
jgi:hypothetical protein